MAGADVARAQECIGKAFSAINEADLPLATWRVHATAAELFGRSGDSGSAEHHRELGRVAILKLANSLPVDEPLRQTFLSAPAVTKVLGSRQPTGLTAHRSKLATRIAA
jgi:hypothetical protein